MVLKQVSAAKGPDADDVRAAGLRSALLLMRTAQTPVVRPAVDKLGTEASKEAFRTSSRLVESCDTALDCYAVKLLGAESGADSVKAASMLGVYGDAKTAPVIVERLARIPTAEGRRRGARGARSLRAVRRQRRGGRPRSANEEWASSEERAAVRRVALRLRGDEKQSGLPLSLPSSSSDERLRFSRNENSRDRPHRREARPKNRDAAKGIDDGYRFGFTCARA